MDTIQNQTSQKTANQSLEDHTIRYDMARMLKDAQTDFDSALASRELIDQTSIAKFFKLETPNSDERN